MAAAHFPWQEMAYIQHDKSRSHISAVPASIGGHLRLLHSAKSNVKADMVTKIPVKAVVIGKDVDF